MNKKSTVMEIFADRLKDLMFEKGMNITMFSQEIGIPDSTISDWLNKKKTPSIESIPKIAMFFKVTTDYLLGLEN